VVDELKTELETYEKLLPILSEDEGRYVLISGSDLVSIYDSYADTVQVGYDKFGLKPFLVKRIAAIEQIHYFSRDLSLDCPT